MREKGWDIAVAVARGGRPVVPGIAVPAIRPEIAESLGSLWPQVFPRTTGPRGHCVLVTAAESGEGVSQVATGLALAGVQLVPDRRVALVDFNLYRPGLGSLFRLPAMPGVSETLSGDLPLGEVPVQTQDMALDVVPAGCVNGHSLSPFPRQAVAELIDRLRNDYDCILLDCPAVSAGEITPVLVPMVDGVLLVVRAASTTREAVLEARLRLEQAGAHLIGAVLNA